MAELAVETVRLPLRAPLRRPGARSPSASWCGCGCASGPATPARARRRRWSPTTACRSRPCWPRSTPTRRCSRTPGRRTTPPRCWTPAGPSAPLPQALAAIDLALWDRAGRRAGRPVAALLGGDAGEPVAVNALVGAEDRAGAAASAAAAVAAGFRCVKVKVGIGDDAGRLAAVRATVGPDVAIRADANGAWGSPREALANLRALAPVGLELCEEPVHGLEALREVRAESPVPVALDESAAEPGAAGSGAADAVCLKIARCGGIGGVLRDAEAARAAGAAVYLASTFDGPHGIAAGLHAAAALRATGALLACGLAAGAGRPARRSTAGTLAVPPGPGLLGAAMLDR